MKDFLIVFDINDTLISKIRKTDKQVLNSLTENQYKKLYSCSHNYLLKRRYTDLLVDYLNYHKLKYIFWSTSMKHNISKMIPYLEKIGYKNHLGFLGQEECEEGEITEKIKAKKSIKNLEVVSKMYNIDINNIVLIDNDKEKHIERQNFIHIKDINLEKDFELIGLCKEIDKFIGCEKNCKEKNN